MMQIEQEIQGSKCLFHGRAMKDYRLSFCKEIFKFVLEHGVPYILSEWFSQDDVENYIGRQRVTGERCDNPTVQDFGCNDITIKLQYSVRPIAGNVRGPALKFNEIIAEPLPKKMR